ncbi:MULTISPECIES: EcoRII N-terminal effector-binding domain-containing protein [unclassified Roseibium]|uniref:EcoRII N-terminal effector-binding domain-containing protein n=1 Tax=unclassified Roseibium TaxID=2629323 RepID=UPI00273D8CC0|nr:MULTISPECIES: EcoRII N-terminal effector-binding domain-containing protein [unclassified Roseibium]
MSNQTFEKTLTANDTGETGGHQAGIHIPKSQTDLLALLPYLDPDQKNPDAWLELVDDEKTVWRVRYVYYNNKLHENGGTRDEYRITHLTKFFRAVGAVSGDLMVLSGSAGSDRYSISVRKPELANETQSREPTRVRLRGWRRVH